MIPTSSRVKGSVMPVIDSWTEWVEVTGPILVKGPGEGLYILRHNPCNLLRLTISLYQIPYIAKHPVDPRQQQQFCRSAK